jgi:hypothetical protein
MPIVRTSDSQYSGTAKTRAKWANAVGPWKLMRTRSSSGSA